MNGLMNWGKSNSMNWTGVAIVAIILSFAAFTLLMWKIGLLSLSDASNNTKIISSTLALVGALIASLTSVIGIIIKHSIDLKNTSLMEEAERRLSIEAERNANLREEAENRLKLEAAVSSIKLLATDSGQPAPMSQRAGALFTLAQLNQTELAVTLTGHLLSDDQVDPNTASWILNRGLQSDDQTVQEEAANTLEAYIDKFLIKDGLAALPQCLFEWNSSLLYDVRRIGASAIIRLLIARSFKDWDRFVVLRLVACLIVAWQDEPETELKNALGWCLKNTLNAVPDSGKIAIHDRKIDLAQVRTELKEGSGSRKEMFNELAEKLQVWANEA